MTKKAVSQSYKNLWPLPATTVLVSSVGNSGVPNIITIGASGIASARPPLISLAFGTKQYSLGLINETGDLVVNIPSNNRHLSPIGAGESLDVITINSKNRI